MSLTTDVIDWRARVNRLLAELGGTEEAVAAKLRSLGVSGQRGEPCDCPIFFYLKQSGLPVVAVRSFVHLADGTAIPLPPPVAEFIRFFDGDPESWPELVEPEEVRS